jgi:RND family efflux transporter MFP subunit
MTKRSSPVRALALGFLILVTSSCQKHEGTGLPPPSGSGAPAAPMIPKLAELSPAAPESSSSATSAAWTGTLFARHEAELGPKMSGILTQITVEEGDRVKKGQLLFRQESAQASLAVDQAKAAIATAQVGYDAAKVDFARASELMQKGSIAPAAYDQAKTANDRAATSLSQAQVALQQAQRGLVDTAVYSPIDGVVTSKLKSVGESATMMPPTVVMVVQDVDKLELRAKLPERALATIKEGSVIRITAPTVNVTREVKVKRINPTIDPRTRTVEVVADVDNAKSELKVGMLVEVANPETTVAAPHRDTDKLADTSAGSGGGEKAR